VVDRLRTAARAAVLDEATARILGAAGTPVFWQDGPDFAAFLAADTGRVLPTVRRIGPIE
jgi:tripartite-type tricarboxylate transporter receptor subunit TctC